MCMAKRKPKSQPTWTDVKAQLADFDRAALLGLIQSLYSAHKDNQMFLHSRFGLGGDVLNRTRKSLIGGFGLTCCGSSTSMHWCACSSSQSAQAMRYSCPECFSRSRVGALHASLREDCHEREAH